MSTTRITKDTSRFYRAKSQWRTRVRKLPLLSDYIPFLVISDNGKTDSRDDDDNADELEIEKLKKSPRYF